MVIRYFSGFALGITVTLLLLSRDTKAHPHMFIDVMTKFMISDTVLTGFHVHWDFDEMNSATIIQEFDINRNGRLERTEYQKIREQLFSYAATKNFFISFRWGLKMLHLKKAENFRASIPQKGRLRYSFFIPTKIPLSDLSDHDLYIIFNDTSLFIAFNLIRERIQATPAKQWSTRIAFRKVDYADAIVLSFNKESR